MKCFLHDDPQGERKLVVVVVFVTMMLREWYLAPLKRNCLLQRSCLSPKIILTSLRYVSTKLPADPLPPSETTPTPESLSKSPQRFEKVFNRTPKFLRKWLQPIANKPLSHVTSFLILHEVAPSLNLS